MILGEQHSKFVIGELEIEIPYSVLMPNWNMPQEIEDESVINGYRTFNRLWDLSEFEVQVNLFKYPAPKTFFNSLQGYIGTSGIFYPHMDGGALLKNNGEPATFVLTAADTYSKEGKHIYDILILTFKSEVPTTITIGIVVLGVDENTAIGDGGFVIGI